MKKYRVQIFLTIIVLILFIINLVVFINRIFFWGDSILSQGYYILFNQNIVNAQLYKTYSGNIKSIKLTNDILELNLYPLEDSSVNTNKVVNLKMNVNAESMLFGVDRNILLAGKSSFYTNSFIQVKVTELNSRLESNILKEIYIFSGQ
jgi:hypothetical protein